jgi:hypothetical protein
MASSSMPLGESSGDIGREFDWDSWAVSYRLWQRYTSEPNPKIHTTDSGVGGLDTRIDQPLHIFGRECLFRYASEYVLYIQIVFHLFGLCQCRPDRYRGCEQQAFVVRFTPSVSSCTNQPLEAKTGSRFPTVSSERFLHSR